MLKEFPVVPPVVASVTKLANPFRLKIAGGNFHPGCSVTIDGSPVEVKYKSDGLLVAKNCKALVPKGVTVQIVVTNSDDGGHSDPFAFSR